MISKYVLKECDTGLQRHRRRWVLVYSASFLLVLADTLFGFGRQDGYWISLSLLGILLYVYSSFQLLRRKQLLEIANLPIANLDERQQQVRLQASELAYTVVTSLASLLFITLFVASYFPWQPSLNLGDWIFIALVLVMFFSSFRLSLVAWLEPDPLPEETDSETAFQVIS